MRQVALNRRLFADVRALGEQIESRSPNEIEKKTSPDEKGELQSSIYDGVILSSCRDTTGFGDFPIDPARYSEYFTHREMHRYIPEYADHFGLHKHIILRTKVLRNALISATGINSLPFVPEYKDRDSFKGEFLHSHYYRRPGKLENKRVVLIGSGSSAVHLVTRRGTWVLPRYVLEKPIEAWDKEWLQTQLLHLVQGARPQELKPEHRLMQQNPTIRSEFLERVRNGTIKVHRANVDSFTETVDADVVISCTGYKRARPYLPDDVLSKSEAPDHETDLYKLVVPTRHRNLYFVGYIEAAGPSAPAMEAQARFVVGATTGRITLPQGDALLQEIRVWEAWHAKSFVRSARHINTETCVPYKDGLLLLGQVFTSGRPPNALSVLNSVYFNLTSNAQWRLFGHGRTEELAMETMLRISGSRGELSVKETVLLVLCYS
ncbi:Fmo5 protein [Xylariales sp. AK1849]|nr:Fmo5 protein [Xylariales sp. AK1849]